MRIATSFVRRSALLFFVACVGARWLSGQTESPLLLQSPTLSQNRIAFTYASSLWTVSREGGEA